MLDAFIRRVRAAYDEAFPETLAGRGYGCPFHLSRCYCGAPSWQQPCPTCDYYPMYGSTGTSAARDSATRETFVATATRHGGIAAWYFEEYRRTVAYAKDPGFAARIDELVEAAKTWEDVPTPGEVWDWVRGEGPTAGAVQCELDEATLATDYLPVEQLRRSRLNVYVRRDHLRGEAPETVVVAGYYAGTDEFHTVDGVPLQPLSDWNDGTISIQDAFPQMEVADRHFISCAGKLMVYSG